MLSKIHSRPAHPGFIATALAGLVMAGVVGLAAPEAVHGATHVVTIGDGFFSPADLTIGAGDTVTWVNEDDSPHTVTAAGFDSGNLDPGQSFSYTFAGAATVGYVCAYHDEMTGSVTIAEGASTGEAAVTTASHAPGHGEGQPNTALGSPGGGAPAGTLATVLIGLALITFGLAFVPAPTGSKPQPIRQGGWRR